MNCNYKVKMKDIQNKYKFKIFCAGYEYDDTELRNAINQRALISEAGRYVELELNPNTYVLTAKLKDKNNNVISTSTPIDLPLESMIVNATYDSTTKSLIITLQNGNTTTIPLGDLIDGLATEEDLNEVRDNLEVVQNELNQYKTIYNVLPKVEDEGEALTLSDTGNATLKIDLKGNTTQEGTPTPDAPVEVETTIGDNTINIVGKNLCNGINQNVYLNNATTLCGIESGNSGLYIQVNGGNYTISTTKIQERYRVACSDNEPSIVAQTSYRGRNKDNTSDTITIDTTGYTYLIVNATDLTAIQIEKGSSASEFQPYQSQTYSINLGDIELCKIGDYQDRIYKDSGKWYIEKKIGKVVLDGSENWFIILKTFYLNNLGTGRPNSICSNFSDKGSDWLSSDENNRGKYTMTNQANQFKCMPLTDMTLEEFKTWLSTHNTIVYYVLATPTTTEITDTTLINQLDTLASAMSYKGQTNISQTNDDLPFIISASALYDLNNLVTRVAILETE